MDLLEDSRVATLHEALGFFIEPGKLEPGSRLSLLPNDIIARWKDETNGGT
ncbi:MAG: hypothetical protein OEM01_03420 [Desulfobulbaceae bacterium]|nr:hypothetical protein [Desulfobulbaceae bacterium]